MQQFFIRILGVVVLVVHQIKQKSILPKHIYK